jgi:hypothetical protein
LSKALNNNMATIAESGDSVEDVALFISQRVTRNPVKVRRAYNKLIALGRENNISFKITISEGWEVPTGLSFPLAVVLASSQFHLDIDEFFGTRRGGHPMNRDGAPTDWDDIQHRMNIAHNRLVLRRGDGDGISITVVATDMYGNNSPDVKG